MAYSLKPESGKQAMLVPLRASENFLWNDSFNFAISLSIRFFTNGIYFLANLKAVDFIFSKDNY